VAKMSKKENNPAVIDADYIVVKEGGKLEKHRSGIILDAKTEMVAKKVVTSAVKSGFSVVLWTIRQVGGLMVAGISGTVDGVKEASSLESKYDNKYRDTGRARVDVSKRNKRPIWDIPTKEEEEMERRMRYG
jgi:hypothetical protein